MDKPTGRWARDPTLEVRLRKLWAEGVSALQIARALGITKNMVVSKRKHLGLPERGSVLFKPRLDPLRQGGAKQRVTGSTLPPLISEGGT